MTTITKTEAEAILERLADKTLSFGQKIECGFVDVYGSQNQADLFRRDIAQEESIATVLEQIGANGKQPVLRVVVENKNFCTKHFGTLYLATTDKILGHEILIGDVLEKILQTDDDCGGLETEEDVKECMALWYDCGLTKPLQEIYNRLEWEMDVDPNPDNSNDQFTGFVKVAKPSPFADLFIFLKEIGL